eukprot:scaffold4131_cov96-Skeletonema_dohrnii-CCMP3373.AAC.3
MSRATRLSGLTMIESMSNRNPLFIHPTIHKEHCFGAMAKMLLMMEFDLFFSDLSSDRHLSGSAAQGVMGSHYFMGCVDESLQKSRAVYNHCARIEGRR